MTFPITLTIQATLDPSDAASVERAHALLEGLADAAAAHVALPDGTPPSAAGAATTADRVQLTDDQLRTLLHQLAVGSLGSPFNPGERLMLKTLAECAPEPLPYQDNKSLLGSGAKFGNVSSGLARRFWNRGYELPYAPDASNTGYAMTQEAAQVVLDVLDQTSA